MPAIHDLTTILRRGTNDNGSTNANLSNGAIIVIVMVSAGFLVLLGFAVGRFFVPADEESELRLHANGDFSQAQYMREVRLRNHEQIESAVGGRRQPPAWRSDSYNDYSGYPSGYSNASAAGYGDSASRYD